MNLKKLSEPFSPAQTHWRVGSTTKDKKKCMALAYIDARDVMDRLDEVLGMENWQCRYSHTATKTVCEIGVRIKDEWVWKSNGAGDTAVEADKGALSDAFKRTAVLWGVGRYLYGLDTPWVNIDQYKRIEKDQYQILNNALVKFIERNQPLEPITENTVKDIYAVIDPLEEFPTQEVFNSWVEELKGKRFADLSEAEGAALLEVVRDPSKWNAALKKASVAVLDRYEKSIAGAAY